jgi:hypothetical protein
MQRKSYEMHVASRMFASMDTLVLVEVHVGGVRLAGRLSHPCRTAMGAHVHTRPGAKEPARELAA